MPDFSPPSYPLPHFTTGIVEIDNLIGGPGSRRSEPEVSTCPGLPKGRLCRFTGDPDVIRELALRIAAIRNADGRRVHYMNFGGLLDLERASELGCHVGHGFDGYKYDSQLDSVKQLLYNTKIYDLVILDTPPKEKDGTPEDLAFHNCLFGMWNSNLKGSLRKTNGTILCLQETPSSRFFEFFNSLHIRFDRLENGKVHAENHKNMVSANNRLEAEFDL